MSAAEPGTSTDQAAALQPPDAALAPLYVHVASARASLASLEEQLDSIDCDSALRLVHDSTVGMRSAFAFIDELESNLVAASALVEATEHRFQQTLDRPVGV